MIVATALATLAASSFAPKASAFPTTGNQRLLVVLVEHANPALCRADATGLPTCPRHTAAEWQSILQTRLNAWFGAESYGRLRWKVRVVANPGRPNGWWPAPHSTTEYAARGNDNFTTPVSIVRDAAEPILSQAIARGVISLDTVRKHRRFLVIDNYHRRGGQAYGNNTPITYLPRSIFSPWQTTAAVAAEDTSDEAALTTIEHELGHQLGEPDLYSQSPCPLLEPGGVRTSLTGDPSDCVGPWDHMALDFLGMPGLGAYTRIVPGWLDDAPPQVRYESRSFSGALTLSPVGQPTGDPLALRLPDNPLELAVQRALGSVLGGNSTFFKGFQAECRRRIGNDAGLPGEGVLVSYLDSTRGLDHPQVVGRGSATETISDAILRPGEAYVNTRMGVRIANDARTANGGCRVSVNRVPLDLPNLAAGVPFQSILSSALRSPLRGPLRLPVTRSAFGNAGVTINADDARSSGSARRRRVRRPRRGRAVRVRFSYANTGTRPTRGGVATVRVSEPYTVVNTCGHGPRPAGRIARRVRLRSLAPGAIATGSARFRARGSGSIGVSVSLRSQGEGVLAGTDFEQSVLAFQTHRRRRGGRRPRTRSLSVVVAASRACRAPVRFSATALSLPRGWSVRGASKLVRPGRRARLRVRVRAPRRGRRAAVSIPLAVVAPANHPAVGGRLSRLFGHGEPGLLGGFDLLARVGQPGGRAPAFILPAAQPAPRPVPYPVVRPVQRKASAISLSCPAQIDSGAPGAFSGSIAPAHDSETVRITYSPPSGAPIERSARSDSAGRFADAFSSTTEGKWTARASWAGDFDHLGAASPACEFVVGP